jgi:hypothetical protein
LAEKESVEKDLSENQEKLGKLQESHTALKLERDQADALLAENLAEKNALLAKASGSISLMESKNMISQQHVAQVETQMGQLEQTKDLILDEKDQLLKHMNLKESVHNERIGSVSLFNIPRYSAECNQATRGNERRPLFAAFLNFAREGRIIGRKDRRRCGS